MTTPGDRCAFVRAITRESLSRHDQVAECYFRRNENGRDAALVLDQGLTDPPDGPREQAADGGGWGPES